MTVLLTQKEFLISVLRSACNIKAPGSLNKLLMTWQRLDFTPGKVLLDKTHISFSLGHVAPIVQCRPSLYLEQKPNKPGLGQLLTTNLPLPHFPVAYLHLVSASSAWSKEFQKRSTLMYHFLQAI